MNMFNKISEIASGLAVSQNGDVPPPEVEAAEAEPAESGGSIDLMRTTEDFLNDPEGAVNAVVVGATNVAVEYGPKLLLALVVLILGMIVAGWVGSIVNRAAGRARVEPTLAKFFGTLVRYVIIIMVVISAIGTLGVGITSFAAILAAAGFAIGLAFQGTLGNFSSGIMLLLFRPFKVGQWVTVAGQSGTVDAIDLFTTTLDTLDNKRVIIPNGAIFGATIENVSFHPTRQIVFDLGVSYAADIDRTREVLTKAAMTIEQRLPDKEPGIVLKDLGASSVDWSVRVWVPGTDFWPARQALIRACKMHLDEAGISIPFPQMDVHIDGKINRD
ncbi:MAG: mechanosensitive ion channel family protein [Phycisphaerales bacterium]|nr:MAG: mechanosensitive ion channel family protein [Phycisphaerales bacterium]